jgi:hypothetical protein
MNDTTIYCWGGCDLFDSLDFLDRRFYTFKDKFKLRRGIDFPVEYHRPRIASTILSLYSTPGDISQRMYESLKPIEQNLSNNETILAEEMLKYPYLEFYKKNVKSTDILLVNFTNELLTKFIVKNEVFTILPPMVSTSGHPHRIMFQWLFDEYLSKDQYHLAFDDRENLNSTTEALKTFANDIYKIFNDRVILVNSYLSNFIKLNNVDQLTQAKVNCFQIPYYKPSKLQTSPLDHEYSQRNLTNAGRIFKRTFSSDIPVVDIGRENYFMDKNHRWGVSPFHYHRDTIIKLIKSIEDELDKMIAKIEKKNL